MTSRSRSIGSKRSCVRSWPYETNQNPCGRELLTRCRQPLVHHHHSTHNSSNPRHLTHLQKRVWEWRILDSKNTCSTPLATILKKSKMASLLLLWFYSRSTTIVHIQQNPNISPSTRLYPTTSYPSSAYNSRPTHNIISGRNGGLAAPTEENC